MDHAEGTRCLHVAARLTSSTCSDRPRVRRGPRLLKGTAHRRPKDDSSATPQAMVVVGAAAAPWWPLGGGRAEMVSATHDLPPRHTLWLLGGTCQSWNALLAV